MNKKEKGFTLIEMLVVVAVIGLLASLILVGLSSFRTRGRDTRRVADTKEIQNGLELYYMKNGSYPVLTSGNWDDLEQELVNANIGITNLPQDPTAPTRSYDYGSDGQHYVIAVTIEDPDANTSLLESDLDGSQYGGVNCGDASNDSVYCIGM